MNNNQLRVFVAGGLWFLLPITQGEVALAQSLSVFEEVTSESSSVQEGDVYTEPFLSPASQALPVDAPIVVDEAVEVPAFSSNDERPYAYTLGPGDQIQIDIFNVPEFSGANGTHFIPLNGSVQFRGLGQYR